MEQHVTGVQTKAAVLQERNRWLIVVLAGGSLVVLAAISMLRRRRNAALLPARITTEETSQGGARPPELRARVAPHLAQLMMSKLFQGLLSQRKQMIATQERAAADVAELEAQLEKVSAPLAERMRAYEQRIAELEKDLAARGAENRELLKAKIGMIRKQLRTTRAKERVELN